MAMFPAGLDTLTVVSATAVVRGDEESRSLPDEVALTIDGDRAVFRKGSPEYQTLLRLLRDGRSREAQEKARNFPRWMPGTCGEMVISKFGRTSHFRIIRSNDSYTGYWIYLPHTNRGGYAAPVFTFDPAVIDLIHARAKSH